MWLTHRCAYEPRHGGTAVTVPGLVRAVAARTHCGQPPEGNMQPGRAAVPVEVAAFPSTPRAAEHTGTCAALTGPRF